MASPSKPPSPRPTLWCGWMAGSWLVAEMAWRVSHKSLNTTSIVDGGGVNPFHYKCGANGFQWNLYAQHTSLHLVAGAASSTVHKSNFWGCLPIILCFSYVSNRIHNWCWMMRCNSRTKSIRQQSSTYPVFAFRQSGWVVWVESSASP